ncbi:MAG: hypothetical protein LCI00_02390 [Chloroflexi bacterium]|nr:hypothetical protein [Chloroflexota bacterium]MCC6893560.1 hypothetical protein [Anaerolineae bacterium]
MKRLIVMTTMLVIFLLGVGVVGAQETPTAPIPNGQGGRPNIVRSILTIVGDETGLQPRDIVRAFMKGQSLAEIIEANGGNVQSVIDQAIETVTTGINQAVADGRITQERADRLLANLPERISQAINGEWGANSGRSQRAVVSRAVLRLAADETGLTVRDIVQEIRAGASLADVLTAHDVNVEAFIDTAVEAAQVRLERAVTNGRLTQVEADTRLEQFEAQLTEHIYQAGGVEATPEATASA